MESDCFGCDHNYTENESIQHLIVVIYIIIFQRLVSENIVFLKTTIEWNRTELACTVTDICIQTMLFIYRPNTVELFPHTD